MNEFNTARERARARLSLSCRFNQSGGDFSWAMANQVNGLGHGAAADRQRARSRTHFQSRRSGMQMQSLYHFFSRL